MQSKQSKQKLQSKIVRLSDATYERLNLVAGRLRSQHRQACSLSDAVDHLDYLAKRCTSGACVRTGHVKKPTKAVLESTGAIWSHPSVKIRREVH